LLSATNVLRDRVESRLSRNLPKITSRLDDFMGSACRNWRRTQFSCVGMLLAWRVLIWPDWPKLGGDA
jgi:hypothetical protein